MPTSDFESGRAVPLMIAEAIWREWTINGVDADQLAGCGPNTVEP